MGTVDYIEVNEGDVCMNKTIMITGAGSGLGRGTAFGLAKNGHKVIAATETTSQKTSVLREAEELGLTDMDVFKMDITNPLDLMQINEYDFDIFVANAAINEGGPLSEIPLDRFKAVFEVNVFGTLASVQHAAKKLVKKGSGKIVFLSSMAGVMKTPYGGPYAATKHTIEALALTLKEELKLYGVKVATINPGPYNTGFNDRAAEEKWKWYDEEIHFTSREDMKEKEKGLDNQFDPEEMISVMVDVIPSDHHKVRTAYPPETVKQMKETEKKQWEMDI